MILLEKKYIFLDFDGVIKDSVEVKSDAFEKLFSQFGKHVSDKIREHHEHNGGMSRFEKIPLYLEWAKEKKSNKLIDSYALEFSSLVKQKVINSEWVPGVLPFLKKIDKKIFFIITATPQQEIEEIISSLNIRKYIKEVIGFPTKKGTAIKMILKKYSIPLDCATMVGDAIADYDAAVEAKISFVLRRTALNKILQKKLNCIMMDDFSDE